MTVINHKSISGITSITAPAGSDDLLTVHTNDTTERFRIVDSGAIVTGVTTASNFKTGTTNVHNVGVELAGINVLGADTPIGTGATIYNSGAAVFTGIVTAQGGVIIDGDNKYLKIGAGNDLGFVHTGSETFITNSTGHLTHRSDVHKWENYAGNKEYIRILSDGKVGINSVSPTYGMHLHGTGASNNAYYYAEQSSAGASAGFRLKTTGSHFAMYGATSGSALGIYDYNASAERFTIDSNGKLGLGIATPDSLLHVHNGSAGSATASSSANLTIESSGSYNVLQFLSPSTAAQQIRFGDTSDNGAGYIQYNHDGNALTIGVNGPEKLRITSGGSVNIGSASAVLGQTTFKSQIETGTNKLISFGNAAHDDLSNEGSGIFFSRQSDGADRISGIFQHTNESFGVASRGGLTFHTGGSSFYSAADERLRITSGGSVNIGGDYTSTTSRLRINTTSYPETTEYLAVFKAGVTNGNRFKNRYIKIRNNYTGSVHGGVPIVWEANADGSNNKAYGAVVTEGDGAIRFLNAAPTSEKAIGTDLLSTISEKLRITSDGKVLLKKTTSNWGTTASNTVIQLENSAIWDYSGVQFDVGHNYYYNSGGAYKYIRGGYACRQTFHNNTGDIAFWSGGTGSADATFTWAERVRIKADGKIGINVTSPDKLLHVSETGNAGVVTPFRLTNTGGSPSTEVRMEFECGVDEIATISAKNEGSDTGPLIFSTASSQNAYPSEKVRITKDGKVGINYPATPPSEDLMVRGLGSTGAITIQHLSGGNTYGARVATRGSTNTGFKIATQFNSSYNDKIEMNGNGQVVISLSGDTNQSTAWPLNLTQAGNHNGTYPGLCIKSSSSGGGSGFSIVAFDSNWGLYTNSGNRSGISILQGTAASSSNAKFTLGEDGVTTIGKDAYSYTHTSRYCGAALHVVKGSLSIGGNGSATAAHRGGVYVLGWYITQHANASYYHLKTDLWAGGSPHGNNEYIMGGFRIEGYSYSSPTGSSTAWIQFHNWNGSYPGLSVKQHYHNWDMGATVYTSSDGYVVLRVNGGTYKGHVIDLIQHTNYSSRDINVSSAAYNNNATHF